MTRSSFASITNEGAIQPHEAAFQRWSSPGFGSPELAGPDLSMETSDALHVEIPRGGGAATERSDTLAVHGALPSFTVYTADQLRLAPLRRSFIAAEEIMTTKTTYEADDGVGARMLLKWTGIGICAGLFVLTGLMVLLSGGDHGALASTNANAARASLVAPQSAPATPAAAPVAATPASVAAAAVELPAPKKVIAPTTAKRPPSKRTK